MLLFGRELQLAGTRLREALALSSRLADHTAQVTGVPVEVWSTVYSPTANSLAFTAFLPDMTALEAAFDKLNSDDEYHGLGDRLIGQTVPGSLTDRLITIVHPTELPAGGRPVSYARAVRSTAPVSRIGHAVDLGIRIAARAREVTGAEALFGVEETGSFVGLSWVYGYADAAEAERFNMQIATDSELFDLLGRTPELFIAGQSSRVLYRRVH